MRAWLMVALIGLSAVLTAMLAVATNLATSAIPTGWKSWADDPGWTWSATVILVVPVVVIAMILQRMSSAPSREAGLKNRGDEQEAAGGRDHPLVVGTVPQSPAGFQRRDGLMKALERVSAPRVSVVFAMTGIRGAGKSQVAAAYAQDRMNEGWRLVAWVDASNEASVLDGLAQVAVKARVGTAGEDARTLAAGVRNWLEAGP